jgi:SAM-dependent methyltransferase
MSANIPALQKSLKRIMKGILPQALLQARKNYVTLRRDREFCGLTAKEAFTKIYSERLWGTPNNDQDSFSSGSGSRQSYVVATYIDAVDKFLRSLDKKPNVVDLGCGDFQVGSKIRHLCGNYIACDIVDSLIARNKEVYRDMQVDFRVVDIASDDLPDGDVVFVRQVLQHLSNELILKTIQQIQSKYKYLVLTEHLPSQDSFAANLDKPIGPDTRLRFDSGVVISRPPFNIRATQNVVLCQAIVSGTLIQTRLYVFAGSGLI